MSGSEEKDMDIERFFSSFREDGQGSDDVSMVSVETKAKDHRVAGDCIGNALVELGAHDASKTGYRFVHSSSPSTWGRGEGHRAACIHTDIHTYIHTNMRTYIQPSKQTNIFKIHADAYSNICIYVCMHVCKYILADEHRVRE